ENVNAYYLEFDDDRSGDFAPLAKVSNDKKVVLGLITSKRAQLEDPDVIVRRIEEASRVVPLDRLYLSTQCGFASTEEGNALTEDQQGAKVALVRSIARREPAPSGNHRAWVAKEAGRRRHENLYGARPCVYRRETSLHSSLPMICTDGVSRN
ncbi:hypothetical protein KXW64_008438, partial [Aspergillus fumigatus]